MKFGQIDINQVIAQVQGLVMTFAALLISFLLFGAALKMTGHQLPYVIAANEQSLAWLCGAWCLFHFRR